MFGAEIREHGGSYLRASNICACAPSEKCNRADVLHDAEGAAGDAGNGEVMLKVRGVFVYM